MNPELNQIFAYLQTFIGDIYKCELDNEIYRLTKYKNNIFTFIQLCEGQYDSMEKLININSPELTHMTRLK